MVSPFTHVFTQHQSSMFLHSRRTFLKGSFLGGAVLIMSGRELFGAVSPLETISLVQSDLFPETPYIPTLKDINAMPYISIILSHSHVSDTEKQFLRNGVQWINEEAVDMYKKRYTELLASQRQSVLHSISKHGWGEGWIESILSYIFEAMLGDPVYGINKAETGWKWLKHSPGKPRPTKAFL